MLPAQRRLLVVKAGSTFPELAQEQGDFEDWVSSGLQPREVPIEVVDARSAQDLPPPQAVAGAVVTGSHSMVTDREAWSVSLGSWMARVAWSGRPLLGICYGHQLLADALGGEVGYHPGGIEVGTVGIRPAPAAVDDPLFGRLPPSFRANVAHRQSVRRLPRGAVLLAGNDFEPHQAYRVGPCAWGVQFHPEFDEEATAAYVERRGDDLARRGLDVADVLRTVGPTPEAASVLSAFGRLVEARETGSPARNFHPA